MRWVDTTLLLSTVVKSAARVQIPRVERQPDHRREVVLDAGERLLDERPVLAIVLRVQRARENGVGAEVDEVALLPEPIAHHAHSAPDVGHDPARDPGEL